MHNTHLDRFIRDLHHKPELRARLSSDVAGLAEQYNVRTADIEAVKRDDTAALVAQGMDPRLTYDPAPRLRDKMWRALTRATASVALVVIGFAGFTPTAQAEARLGLRRARRRSGRRLVRGRRSVRYALLRARARAGERASRVSARTLRRVRARVVGEQTEDGPILKPSSGSAVSVQDPIAQ